MCGYCTEQIALNALNVSSISDAPTGASMLLDWELYLEEVRDFPSALQQLPMQSAVKPYIASVILCRAIEILAVHGFESDVYQKLLQQPKFTYAISVACAECERPMLSDLNIHFNTSSFAWLAEKDIYLKQGSFEQHNNESMDQSCNRSCAVTLNGGWREEVFRSMTSIRYLKKPEYWIPSIQFPELNDICSIINSQHFGLPCTE